MFFHSCDFASTSTTKLSRDCRGHSLASTASHESRIARLICLLLVSEKRIYAQVKRKSIIDQNKFAKNIDAQIIAASDIAKAINHPFVLSKCSPL
jgi:hypothetical protein